MSQTTSVSTILNKTFSKYRRHVAALVVLGLFGALLDGIGINAVIPLLAFLGNGAAPTDFISLTVEKVFNFVHVPFTFRYLLIFIVGLFMVRAVASMTFSYMRAWIMGDFLCDKSQIMLKKTFFVSWSFFLKQKLGYVQNTLVRDIQNTSNLLMVVGQAIQSFTGLFIYILVAINISPIMTLSTFFAGSILMFLVRPMVRRIREGGTAMAATEKKMAHFLGEHVMGMKVVKASGVEERAVTHGKQLLQYMRKIYMRLALMNSLSIGLFQPFSIIFVVILFAIAYSSADFNLVVFGATLYLIFKIFTYVESAQSSLNGINSLVPYARNVVEFEEKLDQYKEVGRGGTEPFGFERTIEFQNVALTYQGGVSAITNLNFSIKKGETVGLIGPSGSGKTSVADLILRLFEPSSGEILVDGKPLSKLRIDDWREHIGYVAQDVFLLNDSIEENIRFYRQDLTDEDIEEAAKQANIYDFVMSLKDGFKTIIGDRGVMLSGGQRQRIILARVLVRRPDILILDEATSALDSESEKYIKKAVKELHGKVTVLIIAHRITTVMDVDNLFVIDKGRIIEEGSPEKLLEDKKSYFHKLIHLSSRI